MGTKNERIEISLPAGATEMLRVASSIQKHANKNIIYHEDGEYAKGRSEAESIKAESELLYWMIIENEATKKTGGRR